MQERERKRDFGRERMRDIVREEESRRARIIVRKDEVKVREDQWRQKKRSR